MRRRAYASRAYACVEEVPAVAGLVTACMCCGVQGDRLDGALRRGA